MRHLLHEGDRSILTSLGQSDSEDDRMIAVILSEEYAKIDNTVGSQVSNFPPAPGVLWTDPFIPVHHNGSHDHQRLIQRLRENSLFEVKVSGDGNCQFRALSDQLFKSPKHHRSVRKEIVQQLKDHRPLYEGYVPMNYKKYCRKMAKSGEWGDHITLQAAADKYGARIYVVTSFKDTCFLEIMPQFRDPNGVLRLSLWSEVHYNSLYPHRGDIPPSRQNPKKKHWLF